MGADLTPGGILVRRSKKTHGRPLTGKGRDRGRSRSTNRLFFVKEIIVLCDYTRGAACEINCRGR
jgi:hypothetical protein